jgi:hypothetical protein
MAVEKKSISPRELDKKQIVFVDYVSNIINFKIAKFLKLAGDYETVLVSFSEVNRELYSEVFDKILVLDMKHKLNFKNLVSVLKKIRSVEYQKFVAELKRLDPYLFQISSPDLFTLLVLSITKNKPKICFAYDIWFFYKRKFSLKDLEVKGFLQRNIEKICMKKSDVILHKGPPGELKFLNYKLDKPNLSLLPGLDGVVQFPKKKKGKELHLVFVGNPTKEEKGRSSFLKIVRTITSQKMHFHSYGECVNEKENEILLQEDKNNLYYHFHQKIGIDKLGKEISQYDYGIYLDFWYPGTINPLHQKTTMGNKLFDYIGARLPTITNRQLEYVSKIVEENGIGVVIDFLRDLKNLKQILLEQDYPEMDRRLLRAQEKFSWEKVLIKEVEEFYKKAVDKKY